MGSLIPATVTSAADERGRTSSRRGTLETGTTSQPTASPAIVAHRAHGSRHRAPSTKHQVPAVSKSSDTVTQAPVTRNKVPGTRRRSPSPSERLSRSSEDVLNVFVSPASSSGSGESNLVHCSGSDDSVNRAVVTQHILPLFQNLDPPDQIWSSTSNVKTIDDVHTKRQVPRDITPAGNC